jgi:hypothetical protein
MSFTEKELAETKRTCDQIRDQNKQIRHIGCYDFFGKILFDSPRENLVHLEGIEEMHILNGTVASTLALWKSPDHLIGNLQALIMIREKIVLLVVPRSDRRSYILAVFEKGTPISLAEVVLSKLTDDEKQTNAGT